MGDAVPFEVQYWLPTGHLLLDLAVSDGHGLPGGKIIEIYGREAGGKTALALSVCAQAQSRGGTVVWLDAEKGFSAALAKLCGLNTEERFVYRRPLTLEKALDAIEGLARKAAESSLPTVIVLDSVAGLGTSAQSAQETTMSGGKRVAPSAAQYWSWFFQRGVLEALAGKNVYLLLLNQVRAKLDYFSYGAPQYATPGGYAIPFYSTIRIELAQPGSEDEKDGNKKKRVASIIRFKVVKNKVSPPGRSGFVLLYHRRGWVPAMDALVYLGTRKALPERGSGRYVLAEFDDKARFKKEWVRLWYEEPVVRTALQSAVVAAFRAEFEADN